MTMKGEIVMVPNVLFYQLLLVALVLICFMIHVWWPAPSRATPPQPLKPDKPQRKRAKEPKPFTGYLYKPLCEACETGTAIRSQAPGSPPPVITFTRGRKRTIDHPGGQPWRQLQCVSCEGYFYETEGTIFHGKRSSPDLIVRVIACLAEGLGIRGTARVFEIDPNTVLKWLVEAADQLHTFS